MATWRAEVFVNSSVGKITAEVEAATFSGAKEQIYAKHGQVRSITNLRQVKQAGSSSAANEPNGCMVALGGVALLIAIATGAFKTSSQPDAYQAPASQATSEASSSPSAEQTPAPEPNETTEPAAAQQPWGAFAVSPRTSESAYATGYSSEDEAKLAALNSCGQSDCNILTTFGSGYATLAESDRNWFYSVGQSSDSDAINEAMSRCEERDPGHNCRVIRTVNF